MGKDLKIIPIKNGTVIDHIQAGQSLNILRILGINEKTKMLVTVAMNVPSEKLGTKDLVMLENRELKISETDRISLIAPNATINIIKDSVVTEKRKVHLPKEEIRGVIKCANPNCISNDEKEPISSKFLAVANGEKLKFRCFYCERIIFNDVSGHIILQ